MVNHGSYMVNDGEYMDNDGEYMVNDGEYMVNDGWYMVNDGKYVVEWVSIAMGLPQYGWTISWKIPLKWMSWGYLWVPLFQETSIFQ